MENKADITEETRANLIAFRNGVMRRIALLQARVLEQFPMKTVVLLLISWELFQESLKPTSILPVPSAYPYLLDSANAWTNDESYLSDDFVEHISSVVDPDEGNETVFAYPECDEL